MATLKKTLPRKEETPQDASFDPQKDLEKVLVTPELAEEWLKQNIVNRTVSPRQVSTMARDMVSGRFKFTPVPIQFNEDGELFDGQHRLKAVQRSGIAHYFMVARNVPSDNRRVTDIGRRRSVADNLVMAQTEDDVASFKNPTLIAAVVRLVLRWRSGALRAKNRWDASDSEVFDFALDYQEELQEAVSYAQKLRRAIGTVNQTATAAAYMEFHRVNPEEASVFFDKIVTGSDLQAGDPTLTFRNAITRLTTKHHERGLLNLELLVRAWRVHLSKKATGQTFLIKNPKQIREADFFLEDVGHRDGN